MYTKEDTILEFKKIQNDGLLQNHCTVVPEIAPLLFRQFHVLGVGCLGEDRGEQLGEGHCSQRRGAPGGT